MDLQLITENRPVIFFLPGLGVLKLATVFEGELRILFRQTASEWRKISLTKKLPVI